MPGTSSAGLGRVQGISSLCARACAALAILMPLAVAALWAFASWKVLALFRLIPPDILPDMRGSPVQTWHRAVGAAICLVPTGLLSLALLRARRSLTAFARDDYFSADVVDGLRGYAALSFWSAAIAIVSVPVISITMSWANPPGHKELSLDLSGAQALNLLAAGILWVIAAAMARASTIARENEQFV